MTPIEPRAWDALLVVALTVGLPFFTLFVTLPRLLALPRPELEQRRPALYVEAMFTQWLFAGAGLHLLLRGYAPRDFGLEPPQGNGLWYGAALLGGLCLVIALQQRQLRADPTGGEKVRTALSRVEWILPRTPSQRRRWWLVSLHAGWGEELLYRGYVFGLLLHFVPVWAAALASSALFGFAHIYQGLRGIVLTTVLGGVFFGLYWASGSLWVPILAHALYDIHAGELGYWAYRERRSDNS
ncbi:MAG: CPBP family intramembrane metalloprotease [Planctomycetes bacterium]|nr:CPBP family intramembrane metalloprotease [Planctomycetota bacterium]MCW8134555.1 CPBP family intramembrane metalloprotease [Planctomycetota bacterium]